MFQAVTATNHKLPTANPWEQVEDLEADPSWARPPTTDHRPPHMAAHHKTPCTAAQATDDPASASTHGWSPYPSSGELHQNGGGGPASTTSTSQLTRTQSLPRARSAMASSNNSIPVSSATPFNLKVILTAPGGGRQRRHTDTSGPWPSPQELRSSHPSSPLPPWVQPPPSPNRPLPRTSQSLLQLASLEPPSTPTEPEQRRTRAKSLVLSPPPAASYFPSPQSLPRTPTRTVHPRTPTTSLLSTRSTSIGCSGPPSHTTTGVSGGHLGVMDIRELLGLSEPPILPRRGQVARRDSDRFSFPQSSEGMHPGSRG